MEMSKLFLRIPFCVLSKACFRVLEFFFAKFFGMAFVQVPLCISDNFVRSIDDYLSSPFHACYFLNN